MSRSARWRACSRFSSRVARFWVRDFRRVVRLSREVCEVRRLSLEVRWVSVGRIGVVGWVRGRPRRDSSVDKRLERCETLVVSKEEKDKEYVGFYISES